MQYKLCADPLSHSGPADPGHCPKGCGERAETSIGLDACESFGNREGVLVCDLPPNGEMVPPGSYAASCGGCALADGGKVLKCTHCVKPGGALQESSISANECYGPDKDIGNRRGRLKCVEKDRPAPSANEDGLPAGSYIGSCLGCSLSGEQAAQELRCSHCPDNDGDMVESAMRLGSCGANAYASLAALRFA